MKRIFSIILTVVLIVSCIPLTAFADDNIIADTGSTLPTGYGTNLVKDKLWYTVYGYNGKREAISVSKNIVNMTDGGSDSGDVQISGFKFAEYVNSTLVDHSGYGDGDRYVDIVFDLKSQAYIDGLAMLLHSNAYLRAREFSVYASDNVGNLFDNQLFFDDRNKTSNGAFRRFAWNFKGMNDAGDTSLINGKIVARYIGIRIFTPTAKVNSSSVVSISQGTSTNNVYVRLEEVAIYGTYTDPEFVYTEKFTPIIGQITKEQLATYGESIIAHRKADNVYYTDGIVSTRTTETDCDPVSRVDYNNCVTWDKEGNHSLELVWKMGDKYKVDSFLYMGADNTYATGKYKIFASLDLESLFEEESMLFEYDAVKSIGADAISSGQYIKLKKPVVAKYFALQILYPVTTATEFVYPRIQEFCVYGTWTDEGSPKNVAAYMPVKIYLKDGEKLDKYELTVDEYRNLVDENDKTATEIKSNGKTVEILLDLCRSTPLTEIILKSIKDVTKYIGKYKVYSANDNLTVWDDTSLLYDSDGGEMTSRKSFSSPMWAKFLRIEIPSRDSTVTVAEIEATGRNDYAMPMRGLSRELSHSLYTFFTMNLKTGSISSANKYEQKKIAYMHDSKFNTTLGITAGKSGEVSSNILVNLNEPAMVHKIRIDFPYTARMHLPTKTRIYISAEYDDIVSKNAKILKEFDGLPIENKAEKALYFSIDILPVSVKYVRIEFLEGGDSKGVFDEMVNAVTEISIRGTSVAPTFVGAGYVKQFSDTEKGVKWGIVKCHSADMFEDVVYSDVTLSDATEWQKSSLRYSPYYKISDGKVYTFKFYGAGGEEITDFGGRRVEFSFSLRDGMTDTNSSVADTGNKWYALPLSDVTVNGGYVTYTQRNTREKFVFSPLTRIKPSDEYWNTLGELEDFGGEVPEYRPDVATYTEIRSITLSPKSFIYNGKVQQPTLKITDGAGNILTKYYYTATMQDSIDVGTYKCTVTFKPPYSGQTDVYYYIRPVGSDTMKVTLSKSSYVYNGNSNRPTVEVTDAGVAVSPENYTVTYSGDGKNVGKYSVTVDFCGIYSGSVTEYYSVTPKAVTPKLTLSKSSYVYNGNSNRPTVEVTEAGVAVSPENYTVTYSGDGKNAGKYSVTVDFCGNYSGSATKYYSVTPKAVSPTVKTSSNVFNYDGKAKIPKFTVTYAGKNVPFTLLHEKHTASVGKHTVTLKLTGNYTFSKKYTYTVIPPATKITSVSAGKKRLTVKWKKNSDVTGYKIQYSTSKKFKNAKTVSVSSKNSSKKVIKKLKAKKKYYIRIRTYKTVGGKKYYSAYSKVKNKRTK